MKQWMKYIVVVIIFTFMAVFFLPKSEVKATGEDENLTVSENDIMTIADSWNVTVQYNLDGGIWLDADGGEISTTQEITVSGSADGNGSTTIYINSITPQKTDCSFNGWYCTVSNVNTSETIAGNIYPVNSQIKIMENVYAGAEITFTAQWEVKEGDAPVDTTIVYVEYITNGGESKFEASEIGKDETETFLITLPDDVPVWDGYRFLGWHCDKNNTMYNPGTEVVFNWSEYPDGGTITFMGQWAGDISVEGEQKLSINGLYMLGDGSWKVNEDPTVYEGGNLFYVPADGNYTFTVAE